MCQNCGSPSDLKERRTNTVCLFQLFPAFPARALHYRVAAVVATSKPVSVEVPIVMPIQEQTMIDAIMHLRGQIDFLWQFFVTVQLALFALIFIYDEAVDSLNGLARLLALFGLGMFSWINGKALRGAYRLIAAVHEQYKFDYGQVGRFKPALQQAFVDVDYSGRDEMVFVTHGVAFAVVAMALLFPSFIQHRRH